MSACQAEELMVALAKAPTSTSSVGFLSCPPAHLKPGILLTPPLAHIFVPLNFFLQTFFWTNPFLSSPAVPWLELFSIHFGTTVIV